MENTRLLQLVKTSCRRLLSEQDRDPYSLTLGCFDRRYWAWKLVDFPEATFQRNVYPLAWWLRNDPSLSGSMREILAQAVIAGLSYTVGIQHRDGSFDQAFPHEHSFGATAFLLHPLLAAYEIVRDGALENQRASIELCLRRAADFLCRHDETHGFISNHLAGAALSLFCASDYLNEPNYDKRARDLLKSILDQQSSEGWFLEYDGADPGYQTLCMYYLAQVFRLRPLPELSVALESSLEFLSWFIHPDTTFGGEYGSRRTAIYYPGGVAILGREFPLAQRMTQFMLPAILDGQTVSTTVIDMGNLAPLLSNYVLALEADPRPVDSMPLLPWQREDPAREFEEAGLFLRGTKRYYSILGVSNGGVLKVFDRITRSILWNDGGYVGALENGTLITTQITNRSQPCSVEKDAIEFETPFHEFPRSLPTPFLFVLLRLLNLTMMRSIYLGNLIKGMLADRLIRNKKRIHLLLKRKVRFEPERVIIQDMLTCEKPVRLQWLEYGRSFVGIHMASARYFENEAVASGHLNGKPVSIDELSKTGSIICEMIL
jgi:hypothetical protein